MCRSSILWLSMALAIATLVMSEESVSQNFETVHTSNAAILNRLGLVPVRIPEGHHKKRLAGPEPSSDGLIHGSSSLLSDSHTRIHQPYSRRHGHRDSHVYIVKLPASQPYYTLTKPHKSSSSSEPSDEFSNKITNLASTKIVSSSSPQVGFHSNGKTAKIYHWNLPIVKKITEKKKLHSQLRIEQMRKKLELEMNDQQQHQQTPHDIQEIVNKTSLRVNKKPSMSLKSYFNEKRFNFPSSSSNALYHDEKPIKRVRNNDKRLNYPKISDDLVNKISEKALKQLNRKGSVTSNKMYRLEDSDLYRLGVDGDIKPKDRLTAWKMSNDVLHGSGNIVHGQKLKKHRKKAAMSYYAPINSSKSLGTLTLADNASSAGIQKNFPGNGKPKAFYVMEKSRQPVYYHPLLP